MITTSVLDRLPQQPPFVFVDKVVRYSVEDSIITEKTIREDDFCLANHFPGNPVVPGVLLIEALLQTGHLWATYKYHEFNKYYDAMVVELNQIKFRKAVKPPDVLRMEVKPLRQSAFMTTFYGSIKVDGYIVVEGTWVGTAMLKRNAPAK